MKISKFRQKKPERKAMKTKINLNVVKVLFPSSIKRFLVEDKFNLRNA
jgi:hypothetical protein